MYNCSKYATTALVESIQAELDAIKSSIRAVAISPGVTQTDFTHRMFRGDEAQWDTFYKENKILQVQDINDTIQYILSLPDYVKVTDIHLSSLPPST